MSHRPQPGEGLTGGDPFPLYSDESLQHTGEWRAGFVITDAADWFADVDR
jgi:hypothetical protein